MAKATRVEAATARVPPCVTSASTAWSPTTRLAKTATRTPVTSAQDTVREMSRSMSYSR